MSRTYGKAQDLIDFTRASSGTALRRVKYGAELVTNGTFDTDSDWIKQTGWSIGSGVASFSGGGGSGNKYIDQNLAGITTDGKVYQITFDVTARTGTGVTPIFFGANSTLAGNTGSGLSVGSYSFNAVAGLGTDDRLYFGCAFGSTISIDNISVKEVTFDTSDGDLVLFNHPNNIPRIEYDANGNLLGLLVEESRTNVIEWSNDFSQWGLTRATITSGAAISPDGTQNATLFTATGDNARIQYFAGNINNVNTASIWVKSATGSDVAVQMDNGGLDIDLFTATTEWQRLENILSTTGVTGPRCRLRILNSGDALYIYHGQLEAGGFMTSAIPTSGSTATRSADVASLSTSAFGYRQDEGTVYAEVDTFGVGSGTSKYIVQLDDATNNNRNTLYISSTDERRWLTGDGGSIQQVTGSGTATNNAYFKTIGAYKENDFALVVDDGSVVTDTVGTTPNGISIARIGVNLSSGEALNGHIKSIKYYPRRLTNAQLQELTS